MFESFDVFNRTNVCNLQKKAFLHKCFKYFPQDSKHTFSRTTVEDADIIGRIFSVRPCYSLTTKQICNRKAKTEFDKG